MALKVCNNLQASTWLTGHNKVDLAAGPLKSISCVMPDINSSEDTHVTLLPLRNKYLICKRRNCN